MTSGVKPRPQRRWRRLDGGDPRLHSFVWVTPNVAQAEALRRYATRWDWRCFVQYRPARRHLLGAGRVEQWLYFGSRWVVRIPGLLDHEYMRLERALTAAGLLPLAEQEGS